MQNTRLASPCALICPGREPAKLPPQQIYVFAAFYPVSPSFRKHQQTSLLWKGYRVAFP